MMAGTDEKELKQIERYHEPADVWKKARNLERRISAGELKPTLPDNPTPDQLAAYRKDLGIPETHTDYDLKFDDGLVIGADDKPIIDTFLETMHGEHASPDLVKKAVAWYYGEQERQTTERDNRDGKLLEESEDALRTEWGSEYRTNMTMISNLLATAPAEVRDLLTAGRLANDMPIGTSPPMLRWLNQLARETMPMGALTGAGGENQMKGLETRIAEIRSVMRSDRPRYNREKMGEELADLLEKEAALKTRAA